MIFINFRKFLFLCFVDFVLFTVIHEKRKQLSFFLLPLLIFISYVISVEKKIYIIEKEIDSPISKPKEIKRKQENNKNHKFSEDQNYYTTSSFAKKKKNTNIPQNENNSEEEDLANDAFYSNENDFYYKGIDKSPKFPSFGQLKSTYDYYFIKSKPKSSSINLDRLTAKIAIPQIRKKKIVISKDGPEFTKKRDILSLIIKLQNNDQILIIGHQIKEVLNSESSSYKKGLYFLAEQITGFITSNIGERRSAFFGLALSEIIPKNYPHKEYFEYCMYEFCERGNPDEKTNLPFKHKLDGIWEAASKVMAPGSILICYWCYINDIENLFNWADTYSQFDIKEYPDFAIGVGFYNLIRFAGKKLYDKDRDRTLQMVKNSLIFLDQYTDDSILSHYSDWKPFLKFYKIIPDFYRTYEKAIEANNTNELNTNYDCYRSLLKYVDNQKKP